MKYFVVADVHGFYSIMKEALDKAGYDPANEDHFFINCGDLFDRGKEARKCLEYVMNLPKERRIFIEGNHESNLRRILRTTGYSNADFHNRTIDTIFQLSEKTDIYEAILKLSKDERLFEYLNELKDYYEIKDYIFVHGWLPRHWLNGEYKKYDFNDYENASLDEWDSARWMNGFNEWNYMHERNVEPIGKTVVCGHWHTAYAHSRFHQVGTDLPRYGDDYSKCCFDIFEDDGIIGLDACTVISNRVNVLVIDDNKH